MKRIAGIIIMLAGLTAGRPWWVKDGPVTGMPLRAVQALNETVVWAVGEGGQVWQRTGSTPQEHVWTQKYPPGYMYYDFNDVWFVDSSVGWIVGEKIWGYNDSYKGIVYRTTDGGTTWDSLPTPSFPIPTPFLKVRMVDIGGGLYQGYISCGNGIVLKYDPITQSWQPTASKPWSDSLKNAQTFYNGLWVDPGNERIANIIQSRIGYLIIPRR